MPFTSEQINEIRDGHDGGKAADRLGGAIQQLAREYIEEHMSMGNTRHDAAELLKIRINAACRDAKKH